MATSWLSTDTVAVVMVRVRRGEFVKLKGGGHTGSKHNPPPRFLAGSMDITGLHGPLAPSNGDAAGLGARAESAFPLIAPQILVVRPKRVVAPGATLV